MKTFVKEMAVSTEGFGAGAARVEMGRIGVLCAFGMGEGNLSSATAAWLSGAACAGVLRGTVGWPSL